MSNELDRTLSRPQPQSERLVGRPEMVENSAGGFVFEVDRWARLQRFLVLGSSGGTYYASERELTLENVAVIDECVTEDGPRTVAEIVRVSELGLAPRNVQAIYALAVCASAPDPATRRAAERALPKVCRIGTHLYQFAGFVQMLGRRGWGRGLRTAVAQVLLDTPVDRLALHAVKYRQREGWSYRDLLRLSHPKTTEPARRAVFDFMCGRDPDPEVTPNVINAHQTAQVLVKPGSVAEVVRADRLPWESVPDQFRKDESVRMALLEQMPVTATVRQLAAYARAGLLKPFSEAERIIVERLTNEEAIAGSRAHPLLFLDALAVHGSGGVVGRSRGAAYEPNQAVLDALDKAFRLAFGNVEPAGKRTYLALDVSGSMSFGWSAGSVAFSPREGSVALALVTAAVEPQVHIAAFCDRMIPVEVTRETTLRNAVHATARMPWGGTDCAQPMLDAINRELEVDTFVIYTDNETWAGHIHAITALQMYRARSGINARLVVVGMTSTGFSIADPNDAGTLDVVGFSTDTPHVITGFSRRDF